MLRHLRVVPGEHKISIRGLVKGTAGVSLMTLDSEHHYWKRVPNTWEALPTSSPRFVSFWTCSSRTCRVVCSHADSGQAEHGGREQARADDEQCDAAQEGDDPVCCRRSLEPTQPHQRDRYSPPEHGPEHNRHAQYHGPHSRLLANQVERVFAEVTRELLQRSDHRSVQALEKDLRDWVKAWNEDPKPFIWTKTAEEILESIARYLQRINGAGH